MRYEIPLTGRTFNRSTAKVQNGPVSLRILCESGYGIDVTCSGTTKRLLPWQVYDLAATQEPITIMPVGGASAIRTYKITRTYCADKEVLFKDECDINGEVVDQDDLAEIDTSLTNLSNRMRSNALASAMTMPLGNRPAVATNYTAAKTVDSYILKKVGVSDADLLIRSHTLGTNGAWGFGFFAAPDTIASMSFGGVTITITNTYANASISIKGQFKSWISSASNNDPMYGLFSETSSSYTINLTNIFANDPRGGRPVGAFFLLNRINANSFSAKLISSTGDIITSNSYAANSSTYPADYNQATVKWRAGDRVIDPVVYIQGNESGEDASTNLVSNYFTNSEALRNMVATEGSRLYRMLDVPDGTKLSEFTNGEYSGTITGKSIKEFLPDAGFGTDTCYMYSLTSAPEFIVRNFDVSSKITEVNNKIAELQGELGTLSNRVTEITGEITTLQNELSSLDGRTSTLEAAMDSFEYDETTNTTTFKGNVAFGETASATGQGSVAGGINTTASGTGSVAFGNNCIASNNYSIALGNNSVSSGGQASIASGNGCTAEGTSTVAIGWDCHSLKPNSFTCGGQSTSHDPYCFTFGDQINNYGSSSIAGGYKTYANTFGGITSGSNCVSGADGNRVNNVINVGSSCTVLAHESVAFGAQNTVSGARSMAMGEHLVTSTINHAMFGKWNADGNYYLSVGGGSNESTRQNLFYVDKNGNVYVKGNIVAGGTITGGS